MEKPQDRSGHKHPIMFPLRRIPRTLNLCPILHLIDTSTLDPQLDLPPHHILIEPQMALCREQSLPDIHALHLRRLAAAPNMDISVVLFG